MEEYEVHTPLCIVIKPTLAQTDIAWLSYSDFSQPVSYSDTLLIDVNNCGEWQFYSFEVEKYFRIEIRTTAVLEHVPDVRKKIILYQFENFNICKYEK